METLALFDDPPPDPDPVVAACPVGSMIDTQQGPWGLATATFDAERIYRYRLSRVWDPAGLRVNFLMLNPSTADAFKVDPTVRRCVGFARGWCAGSVEVTNVFAFRSTDPAGLREAADAVGPGNDEAVVAAAEAADVVVAAWGVHATHLDRGAHVHRLLVAAGVAPFVLRLTRDGHPGHPLYVPGGTGPRRWRR